MGARMFSEALAVETCTNLHFLKYNMHSNAFSKRNFLLNHYYREDSGGTRIVAGTSSFQLSNQGEIDLLFQEIEIYYCDGDEYFGKH